MPKYDTYQKYLQDVPNYPMEDFDKFLEKEHVPMDDFDRFLEKRHDPLYEYKDMLEKEHFPKEIRDLLDLDFSPLEKRLMKRGILKSFEHLGLFALSRNPYVGLGLEALNLALDLYSGEWSYDPRTFDYSAPLLANGFTLCCDGGPLEAWASIGGAHAPPVCSLATGLYCGLTHQVIGGQYGTAITYPENHKGTGWRSHEIMFGPKTDGGIRMTFSQVWAKVWKRYSGGPNLTVTIKPAYKNPLPRGNALTPPPFAVQESSPGFDQRRQNRKALRLKKYQRPALSIQIDPKHVPHTHLAPQLDKHDRLPPDYGDHEKKHNVKQALAKKVILKLYDATTEAKDIVDALYDALDKKCAGARSMNDKAYCVWKNLKYLDVDEAIKNLLANEIEDRIVGRFVGKVGKNTPYGTIGQGMRAPSVDVRPL